MRIAIAQLSPTVGDFEQNVNEVLEAYRRAVADQAQLLVTPELSLFGYPPHDLVDRKDVFERSEAAIAEVVKATKNKKTAILIGTVRANPNPFGRRALNVALGIHDGKIVFEQGKSLLPTYDVFDEARYFEPATKTEPWEFYGRRLGVAICEDLWADDRAEGRKLYTRDPAEDLVKAKVDLVISLSASPFAAEKSKTREGLHANVAKRVGAPLVYVNQVGGTDEILFDGGSFAADAHGFVAGRLRFFERAYGVVEIANEGRVDFVSPTPKGREDVLPPTIEVVGRALIHGIQQYFQKTGFKRAVLGLSGGIDSAVVAALAVEALGAEKVLGVAMPGPYSSTHALEDAEALAANLRISFEVKPIKFINAALARELAEARDGKLEPLALENLQARLRGIVLMTLSNHYGALVLTTGNKSEFATGYCTLYGDMCGALAPLGDVLKTQVYALAHWINERSAAKGEGPCIPLRTISKPPSAELRPDQKDEDSLPPYEILDRLIMLWLEQKLSVSELESELSSQLPSRPGWVRDTLRLIERAEFKRKQAAPVLKVSTKAFGLGRRVPVAQGWKI